MTSPHPASAPPLRRRRWLRLLAWCALVVVLLVASAGGVVWWAFASNYVGDVIADYWRNTRHMPGYLTVGKVVVEGSDRVVIQDLALRRIQDGPPVFTVQRLIASGELWHGNVDRVRIEGAHLDLTADNVRFIHAIVLAENRIPASGPPSARTLDIAGTASLEGVPLASNVTTELIQFGPSVTGIGHLVIDGRPFHLEIKAEGQGEQLHHRFRILPGTGNISVHTVCQRLARLDLLPPIPPEAMPWVPDLVDPVGSEVVGDRHWDLFTGVGRIAWPDGRISAALTIDRKHLRLDQLVLAAEKTVGTLDGTLAVDFPSNTVEVNANRWRPGPTTPLPAIIPVDAILAAMPQAVFKAQRTKTWTLALQLAGSGSAQAGLSWEPGQNLVIDGGKIPVSLLQPFLPGSLDLAAGRATRLRVVVGDRLQELHAEVEQARAIWNGWALGAVEAVVDSRPVAEGHELTVDLMNLQAESRRSLGRIAWRGGSSTGELALHVDDLQALLARLKGPDPKPLPDLRGGIDAVAHLELTPEGVRGRIKRLQITSGVIARIEVITEPQAENNAQPRASTVFEVLQNIDTTAEGPFTVDKAGLTARLNGRIDRGQLNLADHWIDLALRKPIFTCNLKAATGTVAIQRLMLRATDTAGHPIADGFSAGLDVTMTTGPFTATAAGVVDHADLGWLASLLPQTEQRLRGEGAVTFNARLQTGGIQVEGWFLPLGATLDLGSAFRATGLTGAVQFLIANKAGR